MKWQKNIAMLSTFAALVAEYDSVDERVMDSKQKVTQMRHYWDDLDHVGLPMNEKRKV